MPVYCSQLRPVDPSQSRWTPSNHVVWCSYGGMTVLLSLETGKYHTLDDCGAVIWAQLCEGASLDTIASRVAAEYAASVSLAEVTNDTQEFLLDLVTRHLIEPRSTESWLREQSVRTSSVAQAVNRPQSRRADARSNSQVPSFLGCLVRLLIVHVLLKTIGLRGLLRYIARRASPSPNSRVPPELIALATTRVSRAAVWYPFGAACLERSVCLLWVIRLAGGEVDLRIGVQPFPFLAHAWIEYQGAPINESPEYVALLQPFQVIKPECI